MDQGTLSPMTQQLDGRLDLFPSFLLVKSHELLALLDPLCPNPTSTIATLDHGLDILCPTTALSDIYEDLWRGSKDLIHRATLLSQAEAMRGPSKNRSAAEELDHEYPSKQRV
jgi:hypothetical protein